MRFALLAAFLLTSGPAAADCVTLWDMTNNTGAVFKMQNGENIEVSRSNSANTIRDSMVTYRHEPKETRFYRFVTGGVFETEDDRNFVDPKTNALMLETVTRRFHTRLPEIVVGKTWTGRTSEETETHNILTDEITTRREPVTVTYSFLPGRQVKLSGCHYETIPVEATFSGETTQRTRRYIYFPALQVAVMTREQDHRTGIEVKNGIVGLVTYASMN